MSEPDAKFNPYAPPKTKSGVPDVAHKDYVIRDGELWVRPGFQGPPYDMLTGYPCGSECLPTERKYTHSLSIVEFIDPKIIRKKRRWDRVVILIYVASACIFALGNSRLGLIVIFIGFAMNFFTPLKKIRAVGIRPPYFRLKGVHPNYLVALELFHQSSRKG